MKNFYDKATFAAGCFWGVQDFFNKQKGVIHTRVGYTGGSVKAPNYKAVCTGQTGHAEAVEIIFDPKKVNYQQLVAFFLRLHNPASLNRQGLDVGTQYRSAIFYHNKNQKIIAEKFIQNFDEKGLYSEKAVTKIVKAALFYEAEEYHQNYIKKNGSHVCHFLRDN